MIGTIEFPTPKELSDIGTKKRDELLKQEKQKIITKMVDAAENGKFKVDILGGISLPIKQELKAYGYHIKTFNNEYESGDIITWN
jgi:3-methyladenine DNA glycosylase/8-oxoguanine DNA glycosylase